VDPELRARVHHLVSIPMEPTVESLNAGVAAAIIMAHIYTATRP
jgi:tRNA G18 (ribose-2'-O)-methylase SpoU